MKYFNIIILTLSLLFVACKNDRHPELRNSNAKIEKTFYDMSGADSFRCISAMVINMNRPYKMKGYQGPKIAVLKNDTAVIVGIGKEQVVLKRSDTDSCQFVYKRSDETALVAFQNRNTLQVDTIYISGKQGSGQTLMTYAKK